MSQDLLLLICLSPFFLLVAASIVAFIIMFIYDLKNWRDWD
jgi:hypothetical protein